MAIKEQCIKCKGYNPIAELCTIKWTQPNYDGQTCIEFADPSAPKVSKEKVQEDEMKVIKPGVTKRGSSRINNSRIVKGEALSQNNVIDKVGKKSESPFILYIHESVIRGIGLLLLVMLLGGIGYGAYYYINQQQAQEREDLVWKARVVLEAVKGEKTIEYLKLQDMDYTDGLLTLSFLRNYNSSNPYKLITDSIVLAEIASLSAIAPNRWDTICHYLQLADVDLKIVYSDLLQNPTVTIDSQALSEVLLSDKVRKLGLEMFTVLKGCEILRYAKIHFQGDVFFNVDSMSLKDKSLLLCLSYDDSKARLGHSYLRKDRVNPHFTDPVGEMGSILDGMLSICTRTNRGFGFVYTGQKSHKVDRCEWTVDEMRGIAEANGAKFFVGNRKTNQVKTVIVRRNNK